MKRLGCILLLCLALSACLTAGKRGGDSGLVIFDLGPSVDRALPVRSSPMAVEVRAPIWFDTLGIDYRLGYADPTRLREYARARWAGPPAQLIQQRLARALGLIAVGQDRAACVLRVEIDEFSQVFDTPRQSRGLLQGRLVWLDRSRAVLESMTVTIERPASSADSQGGVLALRAAVDALIETVSAHEAALTAGGRLALCWR
jgi:ABC-type uncharacterized transport system auxiliary subunit